AKLGKSAWWQSRGGLVFANSTIRSPLPLFNGLPSALCNLALYPDLCQPFIAAKGRGVSPTNRNSHVSAGLPISNGSIDSANGVGGYYSQNPVASNANVQNANAVQDFPSYAELNQTFDTAKVNTIGSGDSIAGKLGSLGSAIIYDSDDTKPVYIFRSASGKIIDLGLNQITINGAKVIVLVEGDLTISNTNLVRRISVNKDTQSFLMFVVSGNIYLDKTLGLSTFDGQDPLIEGIYLAYDKLIVQSNDASSATPADKKFVGDGSFIGLGGVELQRKFDRPDDPISNEDNAKSPIEQFNFRPDFVVNAPDALKQPGLTWAEIN
ncbi:MAG: hypothetical protein COU66_02015, partial [Candidatus Pacebacteria bacterium CG10_big_fil_rev_8_21_14_0_10_44_11]